MTDNDGMEGPYIEGGFVAWDHTGGGEDDTYGVKLEAGAARDRSPDFAARGPHVQLDAYAGEEGLAAGFQVNAFSLTSVGGEFDPATSGDEQVKLGLSLGAGAGFHVISRDSDHDGYHEEGFGFDVGPVSFEYVAEDEETLPHLLDRWGGTVQAAVEEAQLRYDQSVADAAATYAPDGYSTDGYTTDGYTTDGYSTDGYSNDGYTTDGYTTDGYTSEDSTSDASSYGYSYDEGAGEESSSD